MFGERPQMVMAESPDGDETIWPAGINECRFSEVAGCAEEDTPLLIAEQSHRVEIWRLLFDFGKAVGKLLAELSTCKWAYAADIGHLSRIFCWLTQLRISGK
jgi:hypothetical protein